MPSVGRSRRDVGDRRAALKWFGVALVMAAAGVVLALISATGGGGVFAPALAGWLLAGPLAIGALAVYTWSTPVDAASRSIRRRGGRRGCTGRCWSCVWWASRWGRGRSPCGRAGSRCLCRAANPAAGQANWPAGAVLRRRVDDGGAGRLVDFARARRAGRRRREAVRRLPGLAEDRRSGAAVRRVEQPAGHRSSGSRVQAARYLLQTLGRYADRVGANLEVATSGFSDTYTREQNWTKLTGSTADQVGAATVEHRHQEHRYRHRLLARARRARQRGVARARAQRRTALPGDRLVLRRQDRFHVAGRRPSPYARRVSPRQPERYRGQPPDGPRSRSAGRAARRSAALPAASSCWGSAWAPTIHPATST